MHLIAGPCQAEGVQHSVDIAGALDEICQGVGWEFIFKASFDKANRTSIEGKRGLGLLAGLKCLAAVRNEIGCWVTTDVHDPSQCEIVAGVVDVLQIPAFLCRQTDLLTAAGRTGKVVNIKKGQFMAPHDMAHVAEKVESTGNGKVWLTERGTFFGYNNLVVDFRSLPQMGSLGFPVVFDATHSVQQPGGLGGSSGGQREYVAPLARAAVAVGCDGLFIETHPDPDNAPSDGPNMVPLADMAGLLEELANIRSGA